MSSIETQQEEDSSTRGQQQSSMEIVPPHYQKSCGEEQQEGGEEEQAGLMRGDLTEGSTYQSVRAPPRIRRLWHRANTFLLVALGVAFITLLVFRSKQQWGFLQTSSCAEKDPILTLKDSATVENLQHGAVAADHTLCSEIGTSILRDQGGNAVDAAVATALCLGVANPASSGMGGGAFLLIHSDAPLANSEDHWPDFTDARDTTQSEDAWLHGSSSKKVTEVIDCREVAPAAATTDMYSKLPVNASVYGGLAIGVPGELRGLELAHARHGRLAWRAVVEPAMKLARDGVVVSDHLARDIAEHGTRLFFLGGLGTVLTRDNDGVTPLKAGDIMVQPALANTLAAVMEQGADAVYKGEIAEQIAADVQRAGGILTKEDLANYKATLRSPLVGTDVNGFTVVGTPPPSSGGAAVIGAARFLAGYKPPLASFPDTLSKHRMVEAMRHAFAIRMSLGDPDFNPDVTKDAVKDLTFGSYMESLRKLTLDNGTLPLSLYGGSKWAQLNDGDDAGQITDAHEGDRRRRLRGEVRNDERLLLRRFGYLNDHGTSHFSVVDKDRNAVSMTTSVNTYFGSGIVSVSSGIIMNSQMDDFGTPGRANYFGLKPSEANFIKPGKTPLSSMSPTMIFQKDNGAEDGTVGRLFMVLGASGGPKIITAVLQVFLNFAFLGMPLFESVAGARVHDQLLYHAAAVTTYERCPLGQGPTIEVSNRTRTALTSRGHRLLAVDYTGTVQAIAVDMETNHLSAVSDIRKEGTPAGY